MSSLKDESQIRFYGYPQRRETQDTSSYTAPPANNPVVRGFPLAVVGYLYAFLSYNKHSLID